MSGWTGPIQSTILKGPTGPTGPTGTFTALGTGGTGYAMFQNPDDGLFYTNSTLQIAVSSATQQIQASADFVPAAHLAYNLGQSGMAWNSIFVGPGSLHIGDATLSATGTNIVIQGNLQPATENTQTLGSTGLPWKEIYMGPGTLNIAGPSGANATLGSDQNGIAYAQQGFATPFINIGPSISAIDDPGAIGGWVLGPTGNLSNADYDLIAQRKLPGASVPAGLTGPVYSLIRNPGSTGSTGPTGPAGTNGSAYSYYDYQADSGATPNNGHISWSNFGTQSSSTDIKVSHLDKNGTDIDVFLNLIQEGNRLIIQDKDVSANYQTWLVSGTPTPNTGSGYVVFPITFIGSGGTSNFANNHNIILAVISSVPTGATGPTGPTGPTGNTGPTGPISLNYICQARLTSDQTIPSTADTRILFTDEYDPNNWWTSSNTFNPTINGYYLVTANVWWATGSNNTSNQTNLQIRQNGSVQKAIVQSPIEWNSGNSQSVTRILQLNGTTDYLDITAFTGNPTSQVLQASNGTWFSAALQ